ncbi:MgtC/SapB family protein [Mycolicibacterium aubagnense]|uniref:MgtC/SapB family protein n=1 Tax=Mycolicibacterium aubagnense TaxID=319707 RepID=UPI0014771AA2|nr:MgtC/SapB family protein [Mycolicibacterium aubagnense]MBN9634230.1 MgtC/SapB family protein [Actinomycetota bacterium]WGI36072.1 MgtC/SapB family protein [Mycolicibacterium aubagnense]
MNTLDIVLRIAAGLGLGAAIGLERQWRSRNAGLRTAALVSLGSTLFVVMGGYSFTGIHADPTRVAAQVASGIGFLGAGVIMQQGATISGLNTAATLWASAAVGALAGGGMIIPAAIGSGAVIAANIFLRPVGRTLDRHHGPGAEKPSAEYRFEVRCATTAEVHIRSLVFDAISHPNLTVRSITAIDLPDGEGVRIAATVIADERDDHRIEAALADVIKAPEVTGVRWSADEMSPVD